MTDQASILIIDVNHARAAIIQDGLREAGHVHVRWLNETSNLLRHIADIDPDVIIIDLESPNRDVLEQMFQVSRLVKRPVAMFVDQSDATAMQDAMVAGVSAYVVDGLRKDRVKPILDMCILRFNVFSRLQDELHEAKTALADRKVIERAKGIIMKQRGFTEEEAFRALRNLAMEKNKKLGEIARQVISISSLLG